MFKNIRRYWKNSNFAGISTLLRNSIARKLQTAPVLCEQCF